MSGAGMPCIMPPRPSGPWHMAHPTPSMPWLFSTTRPAEVVPYRKICRPLSVWDRGVGMLALAKATPKRLADVIAHARRARIRDYADCARWLVKSVVEEAPPFKKVWRMKEVETPHGAFGYRAPGAGRAFDRRRRTATPWSPLRPT